MKTNLLKSIFISLILVMGVSNAWGADVQKNAIIYFDNSASQWSYAYHYFAINESYGYKMTKVNNTLLYVHKRTDNTWGGYSSIRLFATTSSWGDPTASGLGGYNNMKSYGANITNTYTNYGFNANNYYYIKPDKKGSTSSHANISVGHLGSSYSSLNKTITVKAKVSTDGGSKYAEATSPGTLSASSYKFTEYNSCASATSLSSGKITCGYTANTTLTAADATGYTFVGWYNSSDTQQTTNKTLSINPTADATYYAYYKANQYTIQFNANGGLGTMSNQSYAYGVSQALTANAFTRTGYTFAGWNTKADGTGTSYTDKQSVSNLSSTDGATITLYAQWAEIPANTHNITYTALATGWTYGAQPASAAEGATVTFEVIPTTGYTVTVTSSDVSLSKNDNTYTFTMPTKDVTINVSATENTHDVTISYKCGDQTIQANGTVTAVGELTAKNITAPEIAGYKFTSWTLGNGITNKSANTTTNPISVTTKASGTYTLTANYEKVFTVYFVNSSKWDAVACHHWVSKDNIVGTTWPGDKLTKTGETVNEFDVYKAIFTNAHTMCIFNNNGAGQKTDDLEVQDGKYYYPLKNQWYASLNDIPAIDPLATNVFLAGAMNGWSTTANEFRKATKEATTASIILNLSANTDYEFKVIRDGAWTGYKGTITNNASDLQFSSSTSDNAKITTTFAGDYTFTWTISSSKLAVTYPTIYAITANANDDAMGTIAGAGEYGKGSTATLTATPNDGYLFVNWTKGGEVVATTQEYSFTVTEAVALVANFEAAPEEVHNVTVSYVCGGNKIADDQTVAAVGVTTPKTAEAPEIFGYTFASWTLGAGVTSADATANPISINIVAGASDYTLTANYTEIPKITIYFVNNKEWNKVYAYGWGGEVGDKPAYPGVDITANKEDEQIANFDVYSYSVTPNSYKKILFGIGNDSQKTQDYTWTDGKYYYADAALNFSGGTKEEVYTILTDPLATNVYLAGTMNDWSTSAHTFKKENEGDKTATLTIELKEGTTYMFKIVDHGKWMSNTGTIKRGGESVHEGGWLFEPMDGGEETNCKLTTDVAGEYTLTWNIDNKKLTIQYPTLPTSGDYRIVYAEKENGSTYSKFHVAQTIQKGDNTTKFVSAFVDTIKNPYILLQKWNDRWETTVEKEINDSNFHNLKGNGVYKFWVGQTDDGKDTIHPQIDKYTGSYYIRTNCANGGWRKYLTQDNAMTYSQKALNHGGYDYYYCKWIQHAGSNISYTIANDYSFSISDTLTTDDIAHLGILPASAYVRFTWNSQTNKLERAYIGESVAIKGEDLKDAIGTDKNALIPSKLNDWQYQVEAQANANTNIQVVADYNSRTQYLKGTSVQPEKIISGSTTRDYQVRLTYDFRTNQLISTLIDNNKISDSISINCIIISREHHNAAQSINITSTGSINNIENATAVMTFEKGTLNDKSIAETERALYWVSFPFSVKLSEVTGNGIYGEHWILEEYDGKARAENGCWAEDTYWKYIENYTDKMLRPHMGYVLALDLTKLGEESDIYDENGNFTIHFPSNDGAISQLTAAPLKGYSTIRFPEYKCTINRPTGEGDRRIKDSNWNIIGVPSFANVHDFTTQVGDVNFYYQWNPADDTYSPQPAATFQTMHAYMVQFAGTIDWGAKTAVSPAAIAARKNAASKDQYTLRLVLQQEGKDQDQTFIRLLAGGATNEFDMNVDLSKIINHGANIYSLIGKEEAAANVLPIEESIIPIGLDIAKTGTYTFAMPDGTDGITAILIDYETQTEHNLLTTEYTVDLNEGINNKRFALRVVPNQVATNIESLFDKNCNQNVQKYIINGKLFIKNNGHIYDIQGRQVK